MPLTPKFLRIAEILGLVCVCVGGVRRAMQMGFRRESHEERDTKPCSMEVGGGVKGFVQGKQEYLLANVTRHNRTHFKSTCGSEISLDSMNPIDRNGAMCWKS